MKSTRARPRSFSPEGEGAHMDRPHGSEGRLFCLDALRETASVSGNKLSLDHSCRVGTSEELWVRLFPRQMYLRPLTKCQNMQDDLRSLLVFSLKQAKKKKKNHWNDQKTYEGVWDETLCLGGGCLPLTCRRLELDGSRWVEQRGCSCLLWSEINCWVLRLCGNYFQITQHRCNLSPESFMILRSGTIILNWKKKKLNMHKWQK